MAAKAKISSKCSLCPSATITWRVSSKARSSIIKTAKHKWISPTMMVLGLNPWSQIWYRVANMFLRTTVRWLKLSTRTRYRQKASFDKIRMIQVCSLLVRETMSLTAWSRRHRHQGSRHIQTNSHLRTLWVVRWRLRRLRWSRGHLSMRHLLRAKHPEMRKERRQDNSFSRVVIAVSIKAQWLPAQVQMPPKTKGTWASSQSLESRRCPPHFQTITTSRSSAHSKPMAREVNPTLINKRSKRRTPKKAISTRRTRSVGVQT